MALLVADIQRRVQAGRGTLVMTHIADKSRPGREDIDLQDRGS